MREKIAVIGSGISGLSIANILKEKYEVVLFEKQNTVGGLIKCERVSNCLFHKVGGHVFNSKNTKVLDWFWSFFDRENDFLEAKRNAKIYFDHKIIGYPIENFLYELDKNLVKQIFDELLNLDNNRQLNPLNYENFEVFLKNNFGDTLYRIYFEPYNKKIWQVDLDTVSMNWLEGKLPMPNIKEVILSNIMRQEEQNMVHSTFYYPKYNGSQFIINRLIRGLDIRTNCLVADVISKNNIYTIGNEPGFEKIIYCGDIRNLPLSWKKLLVANGIDLSYIEALKSNGTSNLFCETDSTEISWLYIPDENIEAHRIIYTGNFSSSNNQGSHRNTCVVEFSGKVSYARMIEVAKTLPGNLSPLSYNYEPNSYVIQDCRTREEIGRVKNVLEKHNIFLLGRFAEWEYYNMDKCIEAAFLLADKFNKY